MNKSLQDKARWSVYVDDLRIYNARLADLILELNESLDIFIDPSKSRPLTINAIKLVYSEDKKVAVQQKEAAKQIFQKEEVKEEEKDSSLIVLPATVDWKWIESLKNNKEDKVKLDEYAQKEFSIELKRSMTLKNMVIDFKEQLEK
jgi:hypothetical protein